MATQCDDKNCPVHGGVIPRGRVFVGTIINAKAQKTATVEWQRWRFIPKYERYQRLRTRIPVHNPLCINAGKGEKVRIQECRPLSKTKKFVILAKIGTDVAYLEKQEGLEEAKVKAKPAKEELQ